MKDFAGKILFITGGASGAGLGQAKVFSEAGCKVVIADVRQDHLDEAKAYFKDKKAPVHTIKLDITDRKAYAEAADEVEKVFGGPPQMLFNTAGVNTFGPAEASTYEDYDWVVGVCLGGVINGMVTFVPRMVKAGKGGYIATVSSLGGFSGGYTTAPYSAAKAAVNNLMESYYQALMPYNIGISILCPGNIKTNIYDSATLGRPKKYEKTGYHVNEQTIEFLKSVHAAGIDPIELANILKKGIENDQLYIIPYPNPEEMLRQNFQRVIDCASPEGTKKQLKIFKDMMANNPMKNAVGFGKAREDLDWAHGNDSIYKK